MLNTSEMRQVRILDRSGIYDIQAQWQDLTGRSLEDNVYYSPQYALALLETVERGRKVRFVTIWNGTTLTGLLPIVVNTFSIPGIRPSGAAWQSLYTFSCVPLIDRLDAASTTSALLDALADIGEGDWLIPLSFLDGELFAQLTAACNARRMSWRTFGSFQRALLVPGLSFEAHMREHVGNKRRRDLARNRRRLEDTGVVTVESHTGGPALARAVEDFLRIEASGWKGRRGTALAGNPDSREFAVRAFAGNGSADGSAACRSDLLVLDGTPIAASMTLFCGRTGFTVKCAYDERYAKYGAGLLLEVETIKLFLDDPWCGRLDAATLTSHVIDSLWPIRRPVGFLAFTFARYAPHLRLATLENVHRQMARTKSAAKRMLRRG